MSFCVLSLGVWRESPGKPTEAARVSTQNHRATASSSALLSILHLALGIEPSSQARTLSRSLAQRSHRGGLRPRSARPGRAQGTGALAPAAAAAVSADTGQPGYPGCGTQSGLSVVPGSVPRELRIHSLLLLGS